MFCKEQLQGKQVEKMSMIDANRCCVEIDVNQFRKNYATVKNSLPEGCRLMAVMKGNAYGHGAARLAGELNEYSGDWIGVATMGEALEIRETVPDKEILILGYTPVEQAELLAEHHITQALISHPYGLELAREAKRIGKKIKAHVAVDTGMSRIGLVGYGEQLREALQQAKELYLSEGLEVGGIFTHFSSAYGIAPEDIAYTRMQYQRFVSFCESLKAEGIQIGLRHCNNSPSIINFPEYALDMCRGGTLLFGFMDTRDLLRPMDLPVVMKFKTIVMTIKEIEPEVAVSYGRIFVSERKTRLAVLAVGWYDGYPRLLGNKGKVLIRGKAYPIVGRVCMDICMADITDADSPIEPGDEAVLLGKQLDQEIKVEELYKPIGMGAGSIGGGITTRVPRIYKDVREQVCMKK